MIYYYPHPGQALCVRDTRSFYGNTAGCRLFLNERDSDVSIRVEFDRHRWRFPAHSLILCAMSDVFRTMLNTDMLEKKESLIIIDDFSALTVKQFLKYLYTGVLDFDTWREAVDLLIISHKYAVEPLVHLLEPHLMSVVSFTNACFLYEIAKMYSLVNLKKSTNVMILDAGFIISATEGFLELSPKSLQHFLSSSIFNMENECCVLSTLKEWATAECIRRGSLLTRDNILTVMEPFMKHINWGSIPEELRTFVPKEYVERHSFAETFVRKCFFTAATLQYHVHTVKFLVELGNCSSYQSRDSILDCLKFAVDNHVFIAGFKILGMFRSNSNSSGISFLGLRKDNSNVVAQFDLNSLPWTTGRTEGNYAWKELTAYLPHPVRIDPFSVYTVSLKTASNTCEKYAKWPPTRLESSTVKSVFGPINFNILSLCFGIAQLFILPAPARRNVCNSPGAWRCRDKKEWNRN